MTDGSPRSDGARLKDSAERELERLHRYLRLRRMSRKQGLGSSDGLAEANAVLRAFASLGLIGDDQRRSWQQRFRTAAGGGEVAQEPARPPTVKRAMRRRTGFSRAIPAAAGATAQSATKSAPAAPAAFGAERVAGVTILDGARWGAVSLRFLELYEDGLVLRGQRCWARMWAAHTSSTAGARSAPGVGSRRGKRASHRHRLPTLRCCTCASMSKPSRSRSIEESGRGPVRTGKRQGASA
jgi:hypothetical protein